jgi:hypothetical protein
MIPVIAKDEVMPLLLAGCPSFRGVWKDYLAGPVYEEGHLYIDLAEFAHHLVELLRSGATEEFPAVFDVVERLHLEGDAFVKEAATIGLLEGIQNVAGNTGVDPDVFVPHMKPETAKWWAELNEFWEGMAPGVGVGPKPEE